MKQTLAFIGGGNTTASFVGGLSADGYDMKQIWVSNPNEGKLTTLAARFPNIHVTQDNKKAVKQADVIILCVKPQVIRQVALELQPVLQSKKTLVISVAAGVREADIQRWLGGGIAIVRCMPNTPALIGCGATGMFANSQVTSTQRDIAESILRAVGVTLWFDNESLIDSVTALSGSGPAYFFLVMEALEQAAEGLGLNRQDARLLTLQTAIGAARMALESGEELAELRRQVTSTGGVTETAIRALESGGLRQLFAYALQEANRKAQVIASMFGQQE